MTFKIRLEPEAYEDIQESIEWYNEQKSGLGRKFHAQVKNSFNVLKTQPSFQIRYDNVHCLPVKKYPYMIHFTVDKSNKIVTVHAVLHTRRDPKTWKGRKSD
ncbi:type II toxin-antitoxin system RelE/ParE family toxin [Reichenbachiella ulvae]|uniref:Type II toxin-antitoxin system RelE/ParE family toxin n=1 Tax=Reichenbachiella ulvae TaxID=2980104 RepID=A0ABT3CVQ0_9BACT|nr:type II toxin-antitoxin system RelE/ParE family toxin [Reichenbachiella ulvae]MCV9387753.1 type II toxin-antitoxin system RelE/ParE family toxin [Reichenbachiella ulvae]